MMAIGGLIGGIGRGLGSLIGGIGSIFASEKANNINEKNFQLQVENLEYQKALQQQIFEREDSTYQRTVNDMRSAGLSPLSMNSTNGSGSVINTTAPQNQFNETLSSVMGIASSLGSLAQIQSGIARTDAETQYIQEQAKNLAIKNIYEDDKLRWENSRIQNSLANEIKSSQASNEYGYTSDMPDAIKQLLILSSGKSFHSQFENYDGSFDTAPEFTTKEMHSYTKDNQALIYSDVHRYITPILEILKAFR